MWEDSVWNSFTKLGRMGVHGCYIHGQVRLPIGYSISPVPHDARVIYKQPSDGYENHEAIASSYSLARSAFALFQAIYASLTLYMSRGDQITRYGYAAFGLTVTPYAIMSFINLVAGILTPEYPNLYLVDSEVPQEASRRRDSHFEGMIGILQSLVSRDDTTNVDARGTFTVNHTANYDANGIISDPSAKAVTTKTNFSYSKETISIKIIPQWRDNKHGRILYIPCSQYPGLRLGHESIHGMSWEGIPKTFPLPFKARNGYWMFFACKISVGLLSLTITSILTRFQHGKSLLRERVWTMAWLVMGTVLDPHAHSLIAQTIIKPWQVRSNRMVHRRLSNLENVSLRYMLFFTLVYSVPAIGGFVIVGKMLSAYGHCIMLR